MSWFGALKTTSTRSGNANFTSEAREKRRAELEADRILKAQKRAQRKAFLQAGISAPSSPSLSRANTPNLSDIEEDETHSLPDLFGIDFSIFEQQTATMVNFDMKNEENDEDAMKNLGQIKIKWNKDDPDYFFTLLETELQIFGIKKQFTKRQALVRNLPEDVALEFKSLVCLQEDKAGERPYKTLKDALLKAHGPRPGAAFQRALSRVMVSKPSVLLKLLVSDICKNNLNGCCCPSTVWGLFQNQIPLYLKNGLANEILTSDSIQSIMERADNLWAANQEPQIAAVSPPVTETTTASTDVAAIRGNNRGRGNRGRGNRGRYNSNRGNRGGASNSNQPDPRGKRHESMPPWNSCSAHWVYADAAYKCQSPTTCPLKDKVTPKA